MANDLIQISVMLPESSKKEWKQTAEESDEYNSMSQLIRTAVGKEISGKYDSGGLARADLQEELDERVVDNLNSVEAILKQVQRQVGNVEENTNQQRSFGRFTRIEVYSAIPKGESNGLTLEDIADKLGEPFTPTDLSVILTEIDGISIDESTQPAKFYREE